MRAVLPIAVLGLVSCVGGGGDPNEDPCTGGNPGLRVMPMPSPDGENCAPGIFQQVTITVSSLGTTDTIHDYLVGAGEHLLPWPIGTFADVPGVVRYEGYYPNGQGIGQAGIVTAPTECLPVEVLFVCHTGPPDAGP